MAYKILSIDGGAMKGVIPARILSYLDGSIQSIQQGNPSSPVPQADLPNPVDLLGTFDLIVGTSTGGLLAAGLTVPPLQQSTCLSADQLLSFYLDQGSSIFGTKTYNAKHMVSGATFSNTGLIGALSTQWGNLSPPPGSFQTVSQSQAKDLLITSFNANQNGGGQTPYGPFLIRKTTPGFQNGQVSLSVLEAYLMTSAFPTLLPPFPSDWAANGTQAAGPDFFVDGGVWAGNPTLAAYLYALSQGETDIVIVSVGCGSYNPSVTPTYSTAVGYGTGTGGIDNLLGLSDLAADAFNTALSHAGIPANTPGWLMTAGVSSPDPTPGASQPLRTISSELVNLLLSGGGIYNDQVLSAILSASGGGYVRLNPEMPLGNASSDGPGNTEYQDLFPAYDSSSTALDYWIQQADTLVQAQLASGAWSNMLGLLTPAATPLQVHKAAGAPEDVPVAAA